MFEIKKEIRDKLCKILKTRFSRVYTNNSRPRSIGAAPIVAIHTSEEKYQTKVLHPRVYDCELSLAIEITKRESKKIEDEIDDLSSEVNKLVCAVLKKNIDLLSVETDFDSETDDPIGGCRLNYRVVYEVQAPAVSEEYKKFKGGNIDFI